ncbi:hypothetical protein BIV57_15605 [Mangrovactinospora gilvigrisea]|uniref:PaaX family transcriptional regulator n=1 Tax=Mangrovactinospora gilvigrisea TaxID=1428644 RepID=A0A1J7BD08_9ACTN|nr:hypothetical protein BIV57_15605 [Mangrovactinospora gilvigrisea]
MTPRRLLLTICGLYARDAGGSLPVAGLVALCGDAGVDEQAVRSAVSRLKRAGLLEPVRTAGGAAGYALSGEAREVLGEGDRRIFAPRRSAVADGWVLAVFSVPERERRRRHELRALLGRLGFGTVAPGVWVAPAGLREEAAAALRRRGLDGYVELFRAQGPLTGEGGDPAEAVGRWWDLAAVRAAYQAFLAEFPAAPGRVADGAAAFVRYARLVTAWRRLPYLDPGIPVELLPAGFPAEHAAARFRALRQAWEAAARTHAMAALLQGRGDRGE